MAEYIKRSDAMKICQEYSSHCFTSNDANGQDIADRIEDDIVKIPTADVAEVVRCRNCKHAYFKYNMKDTLQEIYACRKRPAGRCHKKVSGDFFCARGERRDT